MEIDMINTATERVKSRLPSQRQKLLTMNAFFIAAILFLVHSSELFAQESLTPVERAVPEFSLMDMDGEQWDAESLSGKVWVVNFWATWCPPCIEEIPSMNTAWEILEPEGIGMLAINAGEGGAAVEQFLAKVPIDFPILLGDMDSMPNWSARALPTTLVVDASGNVVFEALGPREWDDEELLQRIIDLL